MKYSFFIWFLYYLLNPVRVTFQNKKGHFFHSYLVLKQIGNQMHFYYTHLTYMENESQHLIITHLTENIMTVLEIGLKTHVHLEHSTDKYYIYPLSTHHIIESSPKFH